jgi:hypothetical protein
MSKASKPKTIKIFSKSGTLGLVDGNRPATELPVDELRKNLESFSAALKTLLPAISDAGGGFNLNTVEVAVGIDGTGHVGFLGTGVEVGAQATITLTFGKGKS